MRAPKDGSERHSAGQSRLPEARPAAHGAVAFPERHLSSNGA